MPARLDIMTMNPPGFPGESVPFAAARAGYSGVINFEHLGPDAAGALLDSAARSRASVGIAISTAIDGWLDLLRRRACAGVSFVVLSDAASESLPARIAELHALGVKVFVQATSQDEALSAERAGADAIIVKGSEAGGRVGEETTFILLQRVVPCVGLPVWARGGVGLHTAAACLAGGAAGVVLDWQLSLCFESKLPGDVKDRITRMDGSETAVLGQELGLRYRAYNRPGEIAFTELKELEDRLSARSPDDGSAPPQWRDACECRVLSADPAGRLLLIGQDAAFAASLADRFGSVPGVCSAIASAASVQCQAAARDRALRPAGPMAQSHGTQYPIVQGPMTRVSDTADFALAVAQSGGLPFLAIALLRGPQVARLLEETKAKLGSLPWGVGILGFVPRELREEQLAEVLRHPPPYSIIAGGRPDQAAAMERDGIHTYLHIPSPALLKLFLDQGVRRVIFEGRECGGHVGPRTSFVLWDSMIQTILAHLASGKTRPQDYHVLFAGGIHDARSAAMIAAMAAPLSQRGVRIGVLMGTSYLFTREAVQAGAILPGFQKEAIDCRQTILLETGVGHATRCADTEFGRFFAEEKRRLMREGKSKDEIRDALERLNLGRLRIASKGVTRSEDAEQYVSLDEKAQHAEGMFMIGQVAALRDRVCTARDLHEEVSQGGVDLLERFLAKPRPRELSSPSDIAIIGMSCMFPKAADLRSFWTNLCNKVNAITEIPADRWDWQLYFDSDRAARDRIYSKWGGFLDDVPFDPTRYGMPPNTLPSIEPLQLLVLEAAHQAIQDAGYNDRPFDRQRASVILGAGGGVADLGLGYGFRALLPYFATRAGGSCQDAATLIDKLGGSIPEWTEDSFAGLLMNVAAGRVANRFDLGGTNYTVDAACASSLAAVRLAVTELESGSSDMVIVGGADTMQSPFAYLCFSKTQALSPTGRCKTFDESADGIVISEGIAMIVLKRLEDAERDGDRVYAVIKGVGSSSDGKDKGLTAPRPAGQMRALERAYHKAGIDPKTVGLIEAHGTGTVAGDQSEVESLTRGFSAAGAEAQGCALGSVKSLIGHTKCSAGVAGLLKAALALHHKTLPPTDGVKRPNPKANFEKSPFHVNTETRPWLRRMDGAPRRAGVSAFGFGGTNFHAVLEEYPGPATETASPGFQEWPAELFVWRAPSAEQLGRALGVLDAALSAGAQPHLVDLSAAIAAEYASTGGSHRLAIVAESLHDLRAKLPVAQQGIVANKPQWRDAKAGVYYSNATIPAKTAFLFPGQGSQAVNMLRDLALAFPIVRETFEEADRALGDRLGRPLSRFIFPHPKFSPQDQADDETALTQTRVAQPAMGAADLALFRLLERLGVRPDLAGGHSYGEYVALCAGGVIDAADLVPISEARGRLIAAAGEASPGTMAAVSADERAVAAALTGVSGVTIANLNSPAQTVVAGSESAIDEAVRALAHSGVAARKIKVSCAFHSPLVARAQEPFRAALAEVPFHSPRLPIYSNKTASTYETDGAAIREQLIAHLISPVRFLDEIEAMYAAGARLFIEVGPGRVLTSLVQRILGNRPHAAVHLDQPGRNGIVQLLHALAEFAVAGLDLELHALTAGRVRRRLDSARLVEQTRPAPLSPLVWMVNGARAIPFREAGTKPKKPARPAVAKEPPPVAALAREAEPAAAPSATLTPTVQVAPSQNGTATGPLHAGTPAAPIHHSPAPNIRPECVEPPNDSVMAAYHAMMAKFLDTQKTVMLAYLHGGGPVSTASAKVAELAASPLPQQVSTPLNGRVIEPAVATEPPGGLARCESPAAVELPAAAAEPESPAGEALSHSSVVSRLLRVVSDRTGYPSDLLDIDLDLEADLGIDSIKRIEILGTLQNESMLGGDSVDTDMEVLAKLKTLRAIADWIIQKAGEAASEPDQMAAPGPPAQAPPVEPAGDAGPLDVPRMLLQPVARALPASKRRPPAGPVLIVDADEQRGRTLAELLQRRGVRADVLGSLAHYPSEPFGGIIYLAPTSAKAIEPKPAGISDELTAFFELLKSQEADLRAAHGCVLVASWGDGAFGTVDGRLGRVVDRGLAGIIKSIAREWPEVACRAIDFDSSISPTAAAESIAAEFLADELSTEVGYAAGRRIILAPAESPVGRDAAAVQITCNSVILMTGGARGITAEIACELARCFAPKLVLVGRSPLPPLTESSETAGLTEPKQLKAALRGIIERSGEKAGPARIEGAYTRLLQDRDIRGTLAAIRAAGAAFEYHAADVCDEAAFGDLIDRVYAAHGRIDGVIHGAGITEDKLVRDKTADSFRRVLAPKIAGGLNLAGRIRPETLQFLFFFSSVSARYGNRGQVDYAAGNEVLNRLAQELNRRWPARIASLNWGPWESSGGMVSAELARQFAKAGIVMISRPTGRRLFMDELLHGRKADVEIIFGGPIGLPDAVAARFVDHRYPLLNSRAEISRRPDGAAEVCRVLDPAYDLYLLDHQLDGKPVMPMAMSLELLAEIAASLEPEMHLGAIRELKVLKGITLENGPQAVRISAKARHAAHGAVRVDLRAESLGAHGHLCYTAIAELLPAADGAAPPSRLVLANPRPLGMTVDQAYEKWLFHGPLFAGIEEVEALGENGIIARLSSSSPKRCLAEGNGSSWLIDPVVVDSGLQLLILWARTYLDMTPLPSRLGCYHRVVPSIKGEVRCEVRIRPGATTPAIHADLMFYDQGGALLGWLEDMEVTCSKALNRLSEVRAGSAGARR